LSGEPVTIFGDGKNSINFISVEDVAKYIVLALEDPRMRNQTMTIGGPQNLTFKEIAAVYERLGGKQVNKHYVPAWKVYLLSRLYSIANKPMAHIMALRHFVVTTNWRVDMSDMMMFYPLQLASLEDMAQTIVIR
jgi:nucleoside-diphosphate-sugar epimerase